MAVLKGEIGPEGGVGTSFGVPFGSQNVTETVGRRIAVREFVGRDEPGTQDLGRKARRYRIQAVLLGPEYINLYNDLVTELERPGRKRLRHPIHGDRIVRVPEQELSVSMTSEGRVDVSFDLIEAGPRQTKLFVIVDVSVPVANARLARDLDARDRMNLLNKIDDFAQSIVSKVRQANSAIRSVKHKINARLAVIDELAHQIDLLDENINSLLDTPQQIANAFGNLVKQMMDLGKTAQKAASPRVPYQARRTDLPLPSKVILDAGAELSLFGVDDPDAKLNATILESKKTPERLDFEESTQAVIDMVRSTAVIETASVLTTMTFESAGQVRDAREQVSTMIDNVLSSPSISPDLADAIATVWSSLETFLSRQAQNLPAAIEWVVPTTMPAIIVAHELHNDARRADEILRRNRQVIANPNFVPGGVPIEVISE